MTRSGHVPFWLWLNVLSLDAPLVALVWQGFLARCYPSVLLPAGRVVLFLSVWAIYIADRLLDVRGAEPENEATRHRFYRQNAAFAGVLLGIVVAADLLATVLWLRPAVLDSGLLAGALVIGYLAVFPLRRISGMQWKQPCAAAVFTVGVFLIAWTGTADAWRILGLPALGFGALCLGNMVLIERWEQGRASGWAKGWLTVLAVACALAGRSSWFDAVAADAAALAAIAWAGGALSRDALGVLADLVLFTPLLLR